MNDVSLLDHSDLQCPEGHGQLVPDTRLRYDKQRRTILVTNGYGCKGHFCTSFITQVSFLQNSHGTREQRRSRIANREIGC